MKLETKIISSLGKVFPDIVKGSEIDEISVLADEPASFQIAYRIDENQPNMLLYVRHESDINTFEEYKVGYVPVINALSSNPDEFFDRDTSGLYPDILYRRNPHSPVKNDGFTWKRMTFEMGEKHLINAAYSWQSMWFTLGGKENPLAPGKNKFTVKFYNALNDELMGERTFTINVIDAKLGSQRLTYTSWFHCDCLADIYGVEMFSDRHFEIIESFAKAAADTGMNMILLPAFTPPLDTPVGSERKTAQLVKVVKTDKGYEFDFSLMERFINICKKVGITHFEHNHLYSQWGAKFAPKIMGYEKGEYKQLFGWDTDSTSEEYVDFIKSYLRALMPVLEKTGVGKNVLFHVSDEPKDKNLEHYKKCLSVMKPEIEGFACGDAISHYEVYKNTDIDTPIVAVSSQDMDSFINNAKNFWVYYTGGELQRGSPNRLISTTSSRNRIIGIQMFYFGATGFLHWGYNYYYDKLSHGICDPKVFPCNYGNYPGASFIVYPDNDGTALQSARMKVFYEGINDYEALSKYAELAGRDKAIEIIKKYFGKIDFAFCPKDDLAIINFRKALNKEIEKYI